MSLTQIEKTKSITKLWWYASPQLIRHGVMLFFFLFLLHVAYDHQVKGGGPKGTPSVEAYCPFGGIESLYQFATTGGFIRRIEPSAMIILGAVLLLTLLFSRGFCGWICPFGSLQEWLGMLGRKIFKKQYNPTGPWERRLRYLKFVILAVIVAFTWHLGTLVFRPYDPFLAFFHLGAGIGEMPFAYAMLAVLLLGSLKYERFFCKYACPLGAVIGILGKVGLTKVVRTDEGCKGCNICQKSCFAHIDFLSTNAIHDAECNHCLDCVVHCPKPNVLALRGAGWSFSHRTYATVLVAGLAGMIAVSQAVGYWRTKPEAVSFTDLAGKPDPDQMRGWMTLADIANGYGIPLEQLYAKAGLPQKVAASTKLNQVAKTYHLDFEPDQMRGVIGAILNQPAASTKQGVVAHGKVKRPADNEEVKGFLTLNEISLKTGVPKNWLLKKLNLPANTDARQPVREWMHAQGKSIQDLRDAVGEFRTHRDQ